LLVKRHNAKGFSLLHVTRSGWSASRPDLE
jgi:hypothetical protein